MNIRESVDSLCRDGSGPPIVLRTLESRLNSRTPRVLSLSGHLAILFERFSTQ